MSKKATTPINRVDKPWGYEIIWAQTPRYVGKLLFVRAGQSLSLQYHKIKEETLFLEAGTCILEVGKTRETVSTVPFSVGDAFHLSPGMIHKVSAVTDCRIFEVSTPELDDVVRLQDNYGRA